MKKQCFKCERVLPVESFYAHPQMADGRLGKCKDCCRKDVSANRAARVDYYREYDRKRYQTEPVRQRAAEAQRRSRSRHPETSRARPLVAHALRAGRLIRKPCDVCGCTNAEAHHEDYTRPLDVRWLCRVHHMLEHGCYRDFTPARSNT